MWMYREIFYWWNSSIRNGMLIRQFLYVYITLGSSVPMVRPKNPLRF